MTPSEELAALRHLAELEAKAAGVPVAGVPVAGVSRETRAGYAPIPAPVMAPKEDLSYSGMLAPFSTDETGDISFDSDAGILGVVKRAMMLPGQAMQGEFDPTSKEAIPRMLEGAAVMSPVGAASRVNSSIFAPKSNYKTYAPPPPTREALKEATTAGYKDVAALDVKYTGTAVAEMAANLRNLLNEKALIKSGKAKDVHKLLEQLKNPPEGSYVRMEVLEVIRQALGDMGGGNKTKGKAATKAIEAIDDFIRNAGSESVYGSPTQGGFGVALAGQDFAPIDAAANKALAAKASQAVETARGNAAAGFRSDRIADLEDVMGLRAHAANSGKNIDNTGRSKLVSLLVNSGGKGVRGFNAAEKQAVREIIEGTELKNALRRVGNMLGGGGGLGQTLTTFGPAAMVGTAGGGVGPTIAAMAPGFVGAAAKAASNRMTKAEIKALGELIRSRSPLANATGGAQQVYAPGAMQDTLLKSLLAGLIPQQQPLNIDIYNNSGGRLENELRRNR